MFAEAFAPHDAIAQLDILAQLTQTPSRDAERCKRLADSLRNPSRVCLLGPDQGDIAGVVAAMLETPAFAEFALPPAMEIRYASELRTTATLEDGTSESIAGWPTIEIQRRDPVFLQIDLPCDQLRLMSVLVLALEAHPAMYRPAISWAARRTEIAVWCTPAFDVADARIWSVVPEQLAQHAYLLETQANPRIPRHTALASFTQVFSLNGGDDPLTPPLVKPLFDRLMADIEEARNADLDMVQLFLHRLGHLIPAGYALAACSKTGSDTVGIDGPALDLRPILSEPLIYIMGRAQDLADELAGDPGHDWAGRVLSHCVETVEEVRERSDNWTDEIPLIRTIQVMVDETCDTMTLLQIEGNTEQALDAAALLFQMRMALEQALGWEDPPYES